MVTDLVLPRRKLFIPKPPSYIKLDMALGVGSGSTLFDKSRYRSHGVITTATWATGLHGKALDFNYDNPDYVTIPAAHTQLNFTSEDFSLIVRLKYDRMSTVGLIFCRGESNVSGWHFYARATGEIRFTSCQLGATQISYSAIGEVALATWYTLGFSREGDTVKVYKNGVDVTSVSGTHIDPASSAYDGYIGRYTAAVPFGFDGLMEFLRIFGGIALPASTHLAYHNALA